MRLYKRMTIISALIALISFLISIFLHYFLTSNKEIDFWINLCLGLFSGAILIVFTSIISYYHEKRRTLEGFLYHILNILSYLNKYQENMSITQKTEFYLNYYDLDKSNLDMDIGNMDFFFEKITGDFKYIYNNIYKPILDFNNNIAKHIWHFRWYLDGTGKKDVEIKEFLSELQEYLLDKVETDAPIEYDDDGKVIATCTCYEVNPKLVNNIQDKIYYHYFEIMYGKRSIKRELKSQKGENNGQNEDADGE